MIVPEGSVWRGVTWHLMLACGCCYMAAWSFGYMIGFTSLALTQMSGILDDVTGSWFCSLAALGGAIGSIIGGCFVDKSGRRSTLMLAGIPTCFGWAILAYSGSASWLLFGRVLTGVGSGILQVACWTYVAEVAPKELRGMLGTGVQLVLTLGVLTAFLLGLVAEWRVMAAIGAGVPIIHTFLLLYIPDTPRFYIKMGHRDMALQSLTWLRDSDHNVILECSEIETVITQERESVAYTWKDIRKPELYRPFRICLVIKLLQQATGIDVVKMYTVDIFQSAGFSQGYQSRLAAVAIGATTTAGTLLAAKIMDLFGRKKLLLVSGAGIAATSFTLGFSFFPTVETQGAIQSGRSLLALSSLVVYCVFFGIGYGPVPMLVTSELLPVRAKGVATSFISVCGWFAAFAITKEFHSMQVKFGHHGAFWCFSLLCVLGCFYVKRFVPETKGKSLEAIELSFHSNQSDNKKLLL